MWFSLKLLVLWLFLFRRVFSQTCSLRKQNMCNGEQELVCKRDFLTALEAQATNSLTSAPFEARSKCVNFFTQPNFGGSPELHCELDAKISNANAFRSFKFVNCKSCTLKLYSLPSFKGTLKTFNSDQVAITPGFPSAGGSSFQIVRTMSPLTLSVQMIVRDILDFTTDSFKISMALSHAGCFPSLAFNTMQLTKPDGEKKIIDLLDDSGDELRDSAGKILAPENYRKRLLSDDVMSKIWRPPLRFVRARIDREHSRRMAIVYANGTTQLNEELVVMFECEMNLSNYPMDIQECAISLKLDMYNADELTQEWNEDNPIIFSDEQKLKDAGHEVSILSSNNRNEVRMLVKLRRDRSTFVFTSYLPSVLLVLIVWIGFFLDLESVDGRINLGITATLTLQTLQLAAFIASDVPSSLDAWMAICQIFILIATVEFTAINWLFRYKIKNGGDEKMCRAKAEKIDFILAVLFPIVFLLVVIIYAAYYG